ncbi:MAG: chalcone isomerase family protein [Rhodoferax sp.]|nr:chalcone isomerase family protein [Rhodoferax sp.]
MNLKLALAVVVSALALNAMAASVDVDGIQVEDKATVAGTQLTLNGVGTRHKGSLKMYVAALYLEKKTSNTAEVFNQSGPKRLSLTMVRNVEAGELGRLFTHQIIANSDKAIILRLAPQLRRMGEMFAQQKKVLIEDSIMIDWVPGTGTVITIQDKMQIEPFKEPEFYKAMLSIWLGNSPAEKPLKNALLGLP